MEPSVFAASDADGFPAACGRVPWLVRGDDGARNRQDLRLLRYAIDVLLSLGCKGARGFRDAGTLRASITRFAQRSQVARAWFEFASPSDTPYARRAEQHIEPKAGGRYGGRECGGGDRGEPGLARRLRGRWSRLGGEGVCRARDVATVTDPVVVPVQLDVTDHARVEELRVM
jgi:hypothetical protein